MSRTIEVPIPANSDLLHTLKEIYFCDAYQLPISNPQIDVQHAYEAVFNHPPAWVKTLMSIRGVIATGLGLKHRSAADSQRTFDAEKNKPYRIGQQAGLFTVQTIKPDELIVGVDDKHLDVKISILRSAPLGIETVTLSTAVEVHNLVGKIYMVVVTPFHRFIARSMLQKAADAGRL
jgi:Protein of unknown function (DUF2867)